MGTMSANINSSGNIWEDDVLDRKRIAEYLENILRNKRGNYVLTINSPWGSGKTFLIERMIKDLKRTNPCIYFNAWEEDSSSSAFLSFISVIQREFKKYFEDSKTKNQIQKYLTITGKFMLRTIPIGIKGGVRYFLGDGGLEEFRDILSAKTEDEIASGLSKWASKEIDEHLAKKIARDDFKKSLSETLSILSGDGISLPLIIFVDDLDRCKPTFSVELLESIKHIFNIENVIFVIAVDAPQLAESVKSVYGLGMDGNAYLKKILENQFGLPSSRNIRYSDILFHKYDIPKAKVFSYDGYTPARFFSSIAECFKLSFRDQEQIFNKVYESIIASNGRIHFNLLNFLMVTSYKFANEFNRYKAKQINLVDLFNELNNQMGKNLIPANFLEILIVYENCITKPNEIEKNYSALLSNQNRNALQNTQLNIYRDATENGFEIWKYLNLVELSMHFQ